VLTHGRNQEADRRREAFPAFLAETLQRERAVEKPHVTQVNDGFHVLGFPGRRSVNGQDRPTRLVTPSDKAPQRLQTTIRAMTARRRCRETPRLKLRALNAVLRGWRPYDRHRNATAIVTALDCWVNQRMFRWLQKRHRGTAHRIMTMDKHCEQGPRDHVGLQHGDAMLFLYRMSAQARTKYRSRTPHNPSLSKDWETQIAPGDSPCPEHAWLGKAEHKEGWRARKAQVKAERGARGERCGTTVHLDLHHRPARRDGGQETSDNAERLCRPCHVQTPT
jgi:RNA-directed DNA polymerase